MILCVSQNNVVTTVYDIFHLYISYHSSSSIYVDLIAPVANVICYYTTSTINKSGGGASESLGIDFYSGYRKKSKKTQGGGCNSKS